MCVNLRENVGAERATDQALLTWAQVLVAAAEQTLANSKGEDKLEYVLTQIDKLFPDLDDDLILAVVEAAVKALKYAEPVAPPALLPAPPAPSARRHTVAPTA